MDGYCDINNAYINKSLILDTSPKDLDQMARQVNASKRAKSKDMYRDYRRNNNKSDALHGLLFGQNQIESNTPEQSIDQSRAGGFYNAQGEYQARKEKKDDSGTSLVDFVKNRENIKPPSNHNVHTKQSVDPINESDPDLDSSSNSEVSLNTTNISDESSSDLSSIITNEDIPDAEIADQLMKRSKQKEKHTKKKKSTRHKCIDFDIDSVESIESLDSGESLLKHIKHCGKCKKKVVDLIRRGKTQGLFVNDPASNKTISTAKPIQNNPARTEPDKTTSKSSAYLYPELKEILTVCLIGFLIIMVLDLVMRKNE